MPRKTRRRKQVTPERLMELSFAYAPPLIISAAVSNRVFDSLEDGAKTSPYGPSATAPRGWRVPVPHGQKTASRRAIFGQKRCLPAFPPSPTPCERSRLANALCFNGNFVPSIPVPILVGGVKQFSVASTVVEAHLRNKSPISSSSSRYSAVASTTVLGIPMR
jgi:hypothetical protein